MTARNVHEYVHKLIEVGRIKTETEGLWMCQLSRFLGGWLPNGDEIARPIIVTPFEGNYGLAGFIICINGSPPRGMVVVELESRYMYAIQRDRCKPIRAYHPGIQASLRESTLKLLVERGLIKPDLSGW